MPKFKYKYLTVTTKPQNRGIPAAIINVTSWSKKEIDLKWDELNRIYDTEKFVSCLLKTGDQKPEWVRKPNDPILLEYFQKQTIQETHS